ncbi:MAG: acylneuraminate cytidylyltransferase family protein [Gammaproteobacteria bacterium]
MIKSKKVLAVIPARGGSKGLPGKNIRPLLGKPLIVWTIESAKKSKFIDQICVSTDSPEIAAVAESAGVKVPFLRPAELAGDKSTSFEAAKHAIDFYRNLGQEFEYIVLLEPTSPIRKETDVDEMLEKLNNSSPNFDSIVSIGATNLNTSLLLEIVDKTQIEFSAVTKVSRRQDETPRYYPFGVAYISKIKALLDEKTFYPKRQTYFMIDRSQCYEIDDIFDFICVEQILKLKDTGL